MIRWLAAAAVAAGTFGINYWRYMTFRVAGPLDLAYFNQQHWNLWHGMKPLTVRPRIAYAAEGPEPWRTMRLRPVTALVTLVYPLAPGVPLLLLVQSLALASGVWPAYRIGKRIAGSDGGGTLSSLLYACSPPLWLLGTNDFRYLYLGLPLVLWSWGAVARRRPVAAALWMLALLCTRSPYCVVVVLLGCSQLFYRRPFSVRLKWATAVALMGGVWFWLSVGYLWAMFGPTAASGYLEAAVHPLDYYGRNPGQEWATLKRESGRLALVVGPSLAAGLAAPELALPAVLLCYPPLKMGLLTLHPSQHYVRYLAPALALLVAASVVAGARLWRWVPRFAGRLLCGAAVVALAAASVACMVTVLGLPPRIAVSDVAPLREAIRRIPADCPVLAFRSVLPNLSSRSVVYDYYQLPPGVGLERAVAESQWAVVQKQRAAFIAELTGNGGFDVVRSLSSVVVLARRCEGSAAGSDLQRGQRQ